MKTLRTAAAAALASAALLATPSGQADPSDAYTAVGAPTVVQPSAVDAYTITLTNDGGSVTSATHATVSIPNGFAVVPLSLGATSSSAGACVGTPWSAVLNAGGTQVDLSSPDDTTGALCPGAALTLQFQASGPAAGGTYTWATQLQRDTTTFTNNGSDPSVVVDGTPPAVPAITGQPPLLSTSANASFTFTDSDPADFKCRLDGGAFEACTSPRSYPALGEGSHTFDVVAVDPVGNTSDAASYTWSVDTVAPTATLTSTPAALTNDATPSFFFSASESGSTFECKLDAGAFAACTSPITYPAQADGPHTFHVRATDAAGNTGSEATSTWTIDTSGPTVTLTSKPVAVTNDATPSFGFSASEAGSTFSCKLDADVFASCASPKTYAAQADGQHTFVVKATDAAGNTGTETSYAWTIDTVAPTVTLTSAPTALTNDATPSFGFSASEGGSTFSCRLDGAAFAACASGLTYPTQTDGVHTFVVKATDAAGNTGAETSYSWTIDTTGPSVTVDSGPDPLTNQTSANFAFSANEPGSTFECRLDSAAFGPCTSPKSYSGLADGAHNFRVRATDPAGNTGAVTTYAWTIDTGVPTVTLISKPDALTNDPTPSFTFSASKAGSTFSCELDAAAFAACTSGVTYAAQADGQHTFHVKATDSAGNTGPETTYSWTIDTTPPPAPTLLAFPPTATSSRSAIFSFSSTEASVTFECRLNSAAFSACSPGPTEQDYASLADGAYTFRVRARDAAGNTGPAIAYDWTVDNVAPTVTLTSKPAAVSNDATPSFAFTAGEAGSTFACKLDAAAFAACTSPITYPAQADGQHTFHVKATDAAGNTGAEATYSWTIDTAAPAVTLTSHPASLTNDPTPSFAFSASEAASSFSCKLDAGAFAACTSPITYPAQPDGQHTFHVKATDAAGNPGPETSYTWTIDTVVPTVNLTSKPPAASNDSTPSFAFSASEAGSTFACKLDGASFGACTSPITYPNEVDGSHTFVVKATDAAGNPGPETSYTWTIDTIPPTVTLTSKPAALTNDPTPTFAFSASETGSSFSCKLDAAVFASCATPKTYAAQADGQHTFVVKATDAAGNTGTETSYAWTIDTVAPTVTLTSKPAAVTDDKTPTFVFVASEAGSTFSCKLDGAAFAPCTSPQAYAAQTDGAHTFHVVATDAAGNAGLETTYNWTIDTVHPIVTISGPPTATNQTSATFTFSSNKDGSTFKCKLDAGSFVACTSPKTYSGLADGPHTLDVQATDPATNTGDATYAWTVDTVAPPSPAIGGGPPAMTNQTSANFAFSDSEGDASFTCQLDGGSSTPCSSPQGYSGLADGPHTFSVRAADGVGNISGPSSYSWTVDTVPPDTAISSGPNLNSTSGAASFTFASNEVGASFTCSVDGGAFSPCSSPQTYSGLPDGQHTLTVRAVDAAGNVDQTPASYSWTVLTPRVPDTTPPARVSRLASAVGYGLFRLSWTLPTDPDFDHVSVFVARTKSGPLQTMVYTGKATTFTNKRFRNGSYYRFGVISYDHAGNHSRDSTVVVSPSALLRSPRNGAVVRKPPLLAWDAVRGATYYNVQVVYAGRKVLSTWPKRSRLQLQRSWKYGQAQRLKKGSYAWYVWPGFGPRSSARFGQLLGQGSFVVR